MKRFVRTLVCTLVVMSLYPPQVQMKEYSLGSIGQQPQKVPHHWLSKNTFVEHLRNCSKDDWIYWAPASCNLTANISAVDTWHRRYESCGMSPQSPIDCSYLRSVYRPMEPVRFFNYDLEMRLDLQIAGASLFLYPVGTHPGVYGGPLFVEYSFVMGVLHFGNDSTDGSEHTIDGSHFTAELQLIHSTETTSIPNCFEDANGLMTIAIMFKEQPRNNAELNKFMSAVTKLRTSDGSNKLDELRQLRWQARHQPACEGLVAGNIRPFQAQTKEEKRKVLRSFPYVFGQGSSVEASHLATLVVLMSAVGATAPHCC